MTRTRVQALLFCASLLPLLLTVVGSRLYWGYWFTPPSPNDVTASLVHVERFTSAWPAGSGAAALKECAADVNYEPGDIPLGRLAAILVARRLLPASDQPVDPSLVPRMTAVLAGRGLLWPGEAGYTSATTLIGHVATGKDATGKRLVVAALRGGQLSNDHYPYYEVLFSIPSSDRLELRRFHAYRFDIAGLEGAFGLRMGLYLTIGWIGILGSSYVLGLLGQKAWRTVRSRAA
jgi:hypothetical protein